MKATLCLVVILMAVVNLLQASPKMSPEFDCLMNCDVPRHKDFYICAESGHLYPNSCEFDCAKSFPSRYKPGDLIEGECKPGSYEHCWNTECTEEERKRIEDKKDYLCYKDSPTYLYTDWICYSKCFYNETERKKKGELVPCREIYKDY